MTRKIIPVAFALFPLLAQAGDWSGEAAFGLLSAQGNAQTRSVNGKVALIYSAGSWKNAFTANATNSADSGTTTAERYAVMDQLNFNFSERDYAFASADYEKDLFGGIRERTSETLGYGRHVLVGPTHTLDAEVGVGARQSKEQITGNRDDDLIGRLSAKYGCKISETSHFGQAIKAEHGASNTYLESITELKLSIVGNLFASLSYTVKNNSDVPPGTESTDTFTAVSLSYSFGPSS